MPDLGQALKESRNAANLSQNDVADAIHVSRQSISKWENNSQMPDISKVKDMCQLYGVTIDQLMDKVGDDDSESNEIHSNSGDGATHSLEENIKQDYAKIKAQTPFDDSALLLVLTVICAFIPIVDLIAPWLVMWKNKRSNRYYVWINIICVVTWLITMGSYAVAFVISDRYF
ncbi:helix-turn-helix domain-containing protein [Weissella tructae]|uniref:HTH cro/C1-type domain-containing protein n=2 Tax=Weissella TaxID=46255 RepID=A0A075U1V1_9LACO|nr:MULTISPECIES: helix-turn-helix transcriptional regulator [Weissella]AIG66153.1 hypothetical protein WS08_1215 [Weissella tructae]AIM63534.1 hypothetical protein WS74_1285 [Weissella ceti]AIM64870.1 hypothetical protein WS105_1280 [Weissella ceti]ELA07526.1 transcriptional regulator [Weissella ceti NC36]QVV91302.1 helix-turn-helix transcriptional regulator [Weissella tructae]